MFLYYLDSYSVLLIEIRSRVRIVSELCVFLEVLNIIGKLGLV